MSQREARIVLIVAVALLTVAGLATLVCSAEYRTANFTVRAESEHFAKLVAETAEAYRVTHWREWFGYNPPGDWARPCVVDITIDRTEGGGVTSFNFDQGIAFDFQGEWRGKPRAILDDVVPHEVLHMVFASEFRRPVPRWIDEGSASTVESPSARQRTESLLATQAKRGELYQTARLLDIRTYPDGGFLQLYSQGHALTSYLLELGGRKQLVLFLRRYYARQSWTEALAATYGISSIGDLHSRWLAWQTGREAPQRRYVYQYGYVIPQNCPDGQCGPPGGYWILEENQQQTSNGWTGAPMDNQGTDRQPPQEIPAKQYAEPTPADPLLEPIPQTPPPAGTGDRSIVTDPRLDEILAELRSRRGEAAASDGDSSVVERIRDLVGTGAGAAGTAFGISNPWWLALTAATTLGGWWIGRQRTRRSGVRRDDDF